MRFDVIIGNPPYQVRTEASRGQARPVYQHFVRWAKQLRARTTCFVVPARWFAGGLGLAGFRREMLADRELAAMLDVQRAETVFRDVTITGGVVAMLWREGHRGPCTVTTLSVDGERSEPTPRMLSEFDVFVRSSEAASIVRRVLAHDEPLLAEGVGPVDPFGFATTVHGNAAPSPAAPIKLYGSRRISWVPREAIHRHTEWIDRYTVLLKSATDGNEIHPLPVWDAVGPIIAGPGEVCGWSYLVVGVCESREEAEHLVSYLRTKFVRFLVAQRKITHHNKADVFRFVPAVPLDRAWSDHELAERYGLSEGERAHIERQIRTCQWPPLR